jgi:hypothetical protein
MKVLVAATLFVLSMEAHGQAPNMHDLIQHFAVLSVDDGFSKQKGAELKSGRREWRSVTPFPGARFGEVSWAGAEPYLLYFTVEGGTLDQAKASALMLKAQVQSALDDWIEPLPDEDASSKDPFYFLYTPSNWREKKDLFSIPSINIDVSPSAHGTNTYTTSIQFGAGISVEEAARKESQAHARLLSFVHSDVELYLKAAETGFEEFKTGAPTTATSGFQEWESSERPMISQVCRVVARTRPTFICYLKSSPYRGEELNYYRDLVADIAASLPGTWARDNDKPIAEAFDSAGFASSDGMDGQIWIQNNAQAEAQIGFQINGKPRLFFH